MTSTVTRAAIYARYSSDRQSERSAEDQARLCQERADREGWSVVGIYPDLALSGATRDRPGLNALLGELERFDVIIAESIDRLSRDQEDIAAIHKRLRFAGVRLVTLSEGEVGEIHVGLGGTMAALYLKQLAEKTRRGQIGRVELGRIPGGLSYGYALEPDIDVRGRPDRGRRRIDTDQADVVRRIFRDYLAGIGPRAIAEALNRDGIPSPTGRKWGAPTILGNRRRGTGILHNELYVGRIVYNRQRFETHPETRKRVARLNPESEWRYADAPELAIVDHAIWDAVQLSFAVQAGVPARHQRRPKRLLSGLVRCGVCGGGYGVTSGEHWACSGARRGTGCSNRAMISTKNLEERVLAALRDKMLAPDVVAEYVREHERAAAEARRERLKSRRSLERRHARAQAQIERLVDAIADGRSTMPEIAGRYRDLAEERDGYAVQLAELEAEPVVVAHPNLAEIYRRQIRELADALAGTTSAHHEARSILRDMIDGIIATPREGARGVDLALQGRLAAILAITTNGPGKSEAARSLAFQVVAGAGFEPATFRL